jgi:hypothetical protein
MGIAVAEVREKFGNPEKGEQRSAVGNRDQKSDESTVIFALANCRLCRSVSCCCHL